MPSKLDILFLFSRNVEREREKKKKIYPEVKSDKI